MEMKLVGLWIFLWACLGFSQAYKIDHVVVLMQENRAFDHLCGWLNRENPEIDGLTGNEFNYKDASDPNSEKVFVNDYQPYWIPHDSGHGVTAIGQHVYGQWPLPETLPDVAPMNGFVERYLSEGASNPDHVMGAFNPESIPVTAALVRNFAIFDRWFCSIAGPTQPNRFFMHSATSDGMANNNNVRLALGMPQKTIYESLQENGLTWTNYFSEVPSLLLSRWTRLPANWNFKHLNAFERDAMNNSLPHLSFIDPRYFDFPGAPQNDNHPGNADLRYGEALIKKLYETLRNSPSWDTTLFIITYDENGGYYDHVSPPKDVPNPDGKVSEDPPYDFTRLGVRVPTIMISPWIEAGVVIHGAKGPEPNSEYNAASIPATIKKMFNLPEFLTKRDAWSGTFEEVFSNRSTPRTDCPTSLPDPPPTTLPQVNQKVDDLQMNWIAMAAGLNGAFVENPNMSEFEGSFFVKEQVCKFFGRCMYEGEDLYDGTYCHLDENN